MSRDERNPIRSSRSILTLASVTVLAACNNGHALRGHVDSSCSLLGTELDHAAKKYEEFALWARGRTPDDTWERQELSLPCRWTARGPCGIQLAARLQFCVNAKKGEAKVLDDVRTRADAAFDRFAVNSDPSAVAAAMRELASLAASLRHMTTKD